jgi:hypothetical protein
MLVYHPDQIIYKKTFLQNIVGTCALCVCFHEKVHKSLHEYHISFYHSFSYACLHVSITL